MRRGAYASCRRLLSALCAAAVCVAAVLLPSCSMMSDDPENCVKQQSDVKTYITVQVEVGDADTKTRASLPDGPGPDGGSDGEGNELGFDNEYKVNDLTLLLFKNPDGSTTNLGDIDDGSNIILDAFYFRNFENITGSTTDKNQIYRSSDQYEVAPEHATSDMNYLIIANAGDVRARYLGMNVVAVADDLLQGGWSADGAQGVSGAPAVTTVSDGSPTFNNFVMTTDNQIYSFGSGDNTGAGTKEAPKLLFGKIKRTAARIDFMVSGGDKKKKPSPAFQTLEIGGTGYSGYVYDVVDENGDNAGKYLLTHVLPFNCQKEGTYFIKHLFSPNWELNAVAGISHLIEYSKLEKEVWTTSLYNGEKTIFKYSTNWVLDPWSVLTTGKGTYTDSKGNTKSCDVYVSHEDKHAPELYTNHLAKDAVASSSLISNTWDYGWDKYPTRDVEYYQSDDKGWCYIVTYTGENTVINKNAYDYATGLVFRGMYFTTDEWNNGKPVKTGRDIAYKYYLRHSDPHDLFNQTGNPDESEINGDKMLIDKTKLTDNKGNSDNSYANVTDLRNTMLYGIVRNNIYRVSINKVIKPADGEPVFDVSLHVRRWAQYTHSDITM